MKLRTIILIIILVIFSITVYSDDKNIKYSPQAFEGFKGLNTKFDESQINPYEASDLLNVLINIDGSIEKRPGCIKTATIWKMETTTYSITTQANFQAGETLTNIDTYTSPDSISLVRQYSSEINSCYYCDTVTANTTTPGYSPDNAVDGLTSTLWVCNNVNTGWLQVVLQDTVAILSVDWYSNTPTNRPADFGIQYWANSQWNTAAYAISWNDNSWGDTFDTPCISKYWLFNINKTILPTNRPVVMEFRLYEAQYTYQNGDSWNNITNFPGDARTNAASFVVGDTAYVGTGQNGGKRQDMWGYNKTLNSWTQTESLSYSAVGVMAFSIGNTGYMGCGLDDALNWRDSLRAYTPATDTWVGKTNFPGADRGYGVAFSIGDTGYFIGGYNVGYPVDGWAYYPPNNAWTQIADYPRGIREGNGFTDGVYGYAGCGRSSATTGETSFFRYNVVLNNWTQVDSYPGNSSYGVYSFAIGDFGYVGCGNLYTTDFYKYNPSINVWSRIDDYLGSQVFTAASFSIGDNGYAGIGSGGVDIYRYDLSYKTETGTFVSAKIDVTPPNTTSLPISFKFTATANLNGGTATYYQRHNSTSLSVDNTAWTTIDSGTTITTTDPIIQLKAIPETSDTNTTPVILDLNVEAIINKARGPNFGLYSFKKRDGTNYLMSVNDTGVYYSPDGVNFTLLVDGLTPRLEMCFVTISDTVGNDTVVFCNGTDYRYAWDGTNLDTYTGTEQVKPKIMTFLQGYLFGSNPLYPTKLYHSLQWHASDLGETNYIEVSVPSGEYISWMKPLTRLADDITSYLLLGSKTTTWGLKSIASSISSGNLYPIFSELGSSSHYGNVNIENQQLLTTEDGIMSFTGSSLSNISDRISPNYDDLGQVLNQSSYWLTTSQEDWQAGETKTNVDTGSYSIPEGSIGMKLDGDTVIINNGFEMGNFTGWTVSQYVVISGVAYEGSYSAAWSSGGTVIGQYQFHILNSAGSSIWASGWLGNNYGWSIHTIPLSSFTHQLVRVYVEWRHVSPEYNLGNIMSGIFESSGKDMTFATQALTGAGGRDIYFDAFNNNCRHIIPNTATYISAAHNTGLDSPYYSIFESDYQTNGQTVSFYVRADTDGINMEEQTWYSATNGYLVSGLPNRKYVQYKIDMSTGDTTVSPTVNSVKINYGINSSINEASLQGIFWDDYYLMASAEDGSTYNNVVYGWNFQNAQWTKFSGWYVNRWCEFRDNLYFGDSRESQIYNAWVGYNDAGETIVMSYKTKAFNFGSPYLKKKMRNLYTLSQTEDNTGNIEVYYIRDGVQLGSYDTVPLYAGTSVPRRIHRVDTPFEFYYLNLEFYNDDYDMNAKLFNYQFGIETLRLLKDDFISME